ncbi:MAG: hypothetical protein C4308_03135 [Chitinophagaceae bacterium]
MLFLPVFYFFFIKLSCISLKLEKNSGQSDDRGLISILSHYFIDHLPLFLRSPKVFFGKIFCYSANHFF